MAFKFITKEIHAYLDYPVALALMILPMVLQLGSSNPMAFWVSVIVGIAAFTLTVLTDHQLGIFRVLPYSFHLAVDGLVGALFVILPLALGFTGLDAIYYWANGIAVLAVVSLHKSEERVSGQVA